MDNAGTNWDVQLPDIERNAGRSTSGLQRPEPARCATVAERVFDIPHQELASRELERQSPILKVQGDSSGSSPARTIWKYLETSFAALRSTKGKRTVRKRAKRPPPTISRLTLTTLIFNDKIRLKARSKVLPKPLPLRRRSGQSCFVCFKMKDRGSFAVQVACQRPSAGRHVCRRTAEGILTYRRCHHTENAVECDADIYWRINEIAFQQYGKWTRYLPFYGVTDVQEVKFRFQGVVNDDGSFPVHIQPLDLEAISERADEHASIATSYAATEGDPCDIDEGHHSRDCSLPEGPCPHEQARLATIRKSRLPFRHLLKKCVQTPDTANSKRTFEGMATESCIYNTDEYFSDNHSSARKTRPRLSDPYPSSIQRALHLVVPQKNTHYDRSDEVRGLHVTIGWRTNELVNFLPFGFGWLLFAASVVWLCTALWVGGTGNTSTGLAFGQLVAASITILVANTSR